MRLLPFRKYRLKVSAPLARLTEVLRREIVEDKNSRAFPGHSPAYQGLLGEGVFTIQRIYIYRSAFMPFIRGRLSLGSEGTNLEILMRPHRQVFVFSTIWYVFLLLFSLTILLTASGEHIVRLLLLAVPLGLGVSSWLLILEVFNSDCRWAASSLHESILAKFPYKVTSGKDWPESTPGNKQNR